MKSTEAIPLHVLYQCFANLRTRQTEWLWPGWLALGKLTILEGDPGLGKSFLTLDLCARLSTGRELPDGSTSAGPSSTIVLSAEDDVEDTIKPRLEAMSADMARCFFMDGVADEL